MSTLLILQKEIAVVEGQTLISDANTVEEPIDKGIEK